MILDLNFYDIIQWFLGKSFFNAMNMCEKRICLDVKNTKGRLLRYKGQIL